MIWRDTNVVDQEEEASMLLADIIAATGGLLSRQIPIVPNLHLQTPDAVDTGAAGEPATFSGSFVAQALASAAHSMSHGSTLFSG